MFADTVEDLKYKLSNAFGDLGYSLRHSAVVNGAEELVWSVKHSNIVQSAEWQIYQAKEAARELADSTKNNVRDSKEALQACAAIVAQSKIYEPGASLSEMAARAKPVLRACFEASSNAFGNGGTLSSSSYATETEPQRGGENVSHRLLSMNSYTYRLWKGDASNEVEAGYRFSFFKNRVPDGAQKVMNWVSWGDPNRARW